jgi:hypothetical protein
MVLSHAGVIGPFGELRGLQEVVSKCHFVSDDLLGPKSAANNFNKLNGVAT